MRHAEIAEGRRFVLVLEPGEELLQSLQEWSRREGVRQALIRSFFGAFRQVRFIATEAPIDDEEAPLPDSVEVSYVEGVGSGSIAMHRGEPLVHLHAAVGVKREAALAYAGHVLAAVAHYTVEVVVDEVASPIMLLEPRAESAGINCLTFAPPPSPSPPVPLLAVETAQR